MNIQIPNTSHLEIVQEHIEEISKKREVFKVKIGRAVILTTCPERWKKYEQSWKKEEKK